MNEDLDTDGKKCNKCPLESVKGLVFLKYPQ